MAKLRQILNAVVFVLLLTIIVTTNIPYGTVDPWWQALFECATFAITTIWIVEGLLHGTWELKRLSVLLPLVLLVIYIFAQAVVWPGWAHIGPGRLTQQGTLTIDRYQTYLTARKTLALTLFLGVLLLHTSSPKRLRRLVQVIIVLGLGSALFGILRQVLQISDSPGGFGLPFLFYGMGYGQFLYHNAFAYLMEMVFALVAGLILGGGLRRDRLLIYLALILPVWTALVLSESRGGILSLTCQSIFLVFTALTWYSRRRLARDDIGQHKWLAFVRDSMLIRIAIIGLIVITLMASVFWMGGDSFASRVSKLDSEQDSLNRLTRREVWHDGWELIKDNPWTGVGFGTFFLAIPQYQKGAGTIRLEQAHDDYIDLTVNGGLVAVALAGWFAILIIRRTRNALGSKDAYRRAAALGAAAGILSIAAHSLVDFGLQVTGIAVVFAVLITIAIADDRVEGQEKGKIHLVG